MSSYRLMIPGVRSSLVFSGFGLKPPVSGFQSYSYSSLKTSPSVTSKAVPSVLASSFCWSLQCLISALTQGGGGGHFFRLTCSVALWGGRDTANKKHWHVLACLSHTGSAPSHGACSLPAHAAQALGCSTRNHPWLALGCLHLPGPSRSGSALG